MKTLVEITRRTACLPLIAALSSVACGGEAPSVAESTIDQETEAFGVTQCGKESVPDDHDETGNLFPAFISPRTYNTCYKSYVVDLDVVDAATAGAFLSARWADNVPQDMETCEKTWGAAVFYKRWGGAWHPLTGVVDSSGIWITRGGCIPPTAAYVEGLEAGATYRIAATMRIDDDVGEEQTYKIAFETY